jgi:hypothetical protein
MGKLLGGSLGTREAWKGEFGGSGHGGVVERAGAVVTGARGKTTALNRGGRPAVTTGSRRRFRRGKAEPRPACIRRGAGRTARSARCTVRARTAGTARSDTWGGIKTSVSGRGVSLGNTRGLGSVRARTPRRLAHRRGALARALSCRGRRSGRHPFQTKRLWTRFSPKICTVVHKVMNRKVVDLTIPYNFHEGSRVYFSIVFA